jgi:hypothetical protein
MAAKKQTISREQAIQTLESAGIKGVDWDKIDIGRILAFVLYVLEFFRNPPQQVKTAMDHDPASSCLCEAICKNLEAVQIMANHLEEHHPTPTPPEPTT